MLQFLILGAGRPFSGELHTALRAVGNSAHVLDWSLRAVSFLSPSCHFVSGYQAESVQAAYPEFSYTYNSDWDTTRAGWSLLSALPETPKETLVSYSDILFHESTVKRLFAADGDVVVAVDSQWRSRYAGRHLEDMQRCEKVCTAEESITLLGTGIDLSQANAEFVGLARFSADAIKQLSEIYKLAGSESTSLKQANLTLLIELLRIRGFKITAVDVQGDWAELNEPADLARFILGTKAQTLSRLKQMVTLSRIEDQVSFTVAQWYKNTPQWVSEIQETLGQGRLIMRSSALSEDGFLNSSAGVYTSVLDVQGNSVKAIQEAVETVIQSYPDKNPENEVLVQPMLANVQASGVIFTRSLAMGAPYYTVNYDDISGSTESITDGTSQEDKTLVIRRDADPHSQAIPSNLQCLLPALREIEALLGYDSLDFEFAITAEHGLHILQVRPIAVDHTSTDASDEDFYTLIEQAKARFLSLQQPSPFVLGERALFGVMPDWNPAEIIGTKPSVLATSLYRNLILDDTWATQRAEYGYRDVRPQPLLISFAGHPYIDIRASFNSFIPAELPDALAGKVVDFCLNWLEKHPELHDKVEFDVIPTCFDLDFKRWEERFSNQGGFSPAEINQIREAQLRLTSAALQRNANDLAVIEQLEKRYASIKAVNLPSLEKAFVLLEDCRRYGTLPFAHLARSAFIAVSLLRSAVSVGVLSEAERDDFLNTIHTVSQDLTVDSVACAEGKLTWDDFVEKYGHLRPGTYDITSPSYWHDAERYLRPIVSRAALSQQTQVEETGLLWASARGKFGSAVAESGLSVSIDELETFMRTAIEGREYAKFAFTRNLSLALDELARWGETHAIDTDTLAQLSIDDLRLLSRGTVVTSNMTEWMQNRAKENQQCTEIIEGLELPPLLCSTDDFSVFLYPTTHANYIGSSSVTAACVDLEHSQGTELELENKIVLIPQADPGYDWLFGRNIAGLITMYGGANSHMAIRAAEFGLPAAIGIGETHYRSLSTAAELELNTGLRIIRVIH